MNKKQFLLMSVVSTLIISSFGIMSVFASDSENVSNHIQQFQNRFKTILTEEQKNEMQTKRIEMESQREMQLAKWEVMDITSWKQQKIDKINATTQAEFDKIKEREVNVPKKGKVFGPRHDQRRIENIEE
jgi:hypothetical protein